MPASDIVLGLLITLLGSVMLAHVAQWDWTQRFSAGIAIISTIVFIYRSVVLYRAKNRTDTEIALQSAKPANLQQSPQTVEGGAGGFAQATEKGVAMGGAGGPAGTSGNGGRGGDAKADGAGSIAIGGAGGAGGDTPATQDTMPKRTNSSERSLIGPGRLGPGRSETRKLLEYTLVTDADLSQLCIDHFPDIAKRFTDGMDRKEKLNFLIQSHSQHEIMSALQESFPSKFNEYRAVNDANLGGVKRNP